MTKFINNQIYIDGREVAISMGDSLRLAAQIGNDRRAIVGTGREWRLPFGPRR